MALLHSPLARPGPAVGLAALGLPSERFVSLTLFFFFPSFPVFFLFASMPGLVECRQNKKEVV